jgi:hypothetical protein
MVFSGDNFWRNFGLEDGGFDELVEASRRRRAQLAASGSDDPQRARGRGLAASAARGREGPGRQRRMVDGVTSRPSRRRAGSSRVRSVTRARSAQLMPGRDMRRWSTASCWRRTRISISLVASDRTHGTTQLMSLENNRWIKLNATGGSCRSRAGGDAAGQRVCAKFRAPTDIQGSGDQMQELH